MPRLPSSRNVASPGSPDFTFLIPAHPGSPEQRQGQELRLGMNTDYNHNVSFYSHFNIWNGCTGWPS